VGEKMLEIYFDKDKVKASTFKPGDSFGMDMDTTNFDEWQKRLPAPNLSTEGIRAQHLNLAEALDEEFKPIPVKDSPAQRLTNPEAAVIADFRENTARGLCVIAGDHGDREESEFGTSRQVEIDSSEYRFSQVRSQLTMNKESGSIEQLRVLVGFHQIMDKTDPDNEPCWLIPDVSGHNRAASAGEEGEILEPERFTSGPVAFVHVLRGIHGRPSQLDDALFPRFSEAAFREAVEHFVAKYSDMDEMKGTFSVVEEQIFSRLESDYPGKDIRITNLRLVESRQEHSMFHFALAVEVGEESKVEDFGVFLTAIGSLELEKF
jgi:hypothetical protein